MSDGCPIRVRRLSECPNRQCRETGTGLGGSEKAPDRFRWLRTTTDKGRKSRFQGSDVRASHRNSDCQSQGCDRQSQNRSESGNSLAKQIPGTEPSRFPSAQHSQGRQETTREGTRRTENSAAGSHNATRTRSSTTRLDWTQDQWGNGGDNRLFGLLPVMDYTNSSSYDPGQ